jgi:MFS family permease
MNRNLIFLAASLITWGVGEGMFIFFQPLYLQELGADPVTIGAILGGVGIAMTLAHLPAGYLSDRFGRRPLLRAAWFTANIAAWIMALAENLPVFVLGAVLYGMTAFVSGPMSGYITAARGKWSVARALTLISATYNLGAILGPLLGGWVGEMFGLRWSFILAGAWFVVSTLLILFIESQPIEATQPESNQNRWGDFLQPRYITLMAIIFMAMFSMYLPQPLSQNFLQNERGLDLGQIGQMISLRSAGVVVFNLILGVVNARYGFLLAQAAVGLYCWLIWQGNSIPWYMAGYFMMGNFQTARSMATAHVRALVKANNMGMAYGMQETLSGMVVILGPPLAGYLYTRNPEWIYLAGLIGICASVVISALFIPLKPNEIS